MSVLQIVRWFLLIAEISVSLPILYLCVLSVSAILFARKRQAEYAQSSCTTIPAGIRFVILIPAHNEEIVLGTLLRCLSSLVYPKDLYRVYVVADNCTDGTADLVRAMGGTYVYERFDQSRHGKGFALDWILQKLEEEQVEYDACVILDADSVVVPTFLQAMARELAQGAQALQGHYTVLNMTEGHSTALRSIALTLVQHVRPLGRNGLGASATLYGNGMCLRRSLLLRHPWQAFSVGEDYEYYLRLIEHGERVRYVPEAMVRALMPKTFAQMRTQDIRWETVGPGLSIWPIAFRLLRAGLQAHDFVRIEAVAELLTPPLSLLVCWCLLAAVLSYLVRSFPLLLFSFILLGGLMCYIGTALYFLRSRCVLFNALLYAPGFMLWKLWVYFVLSRSKKYRTTWIRTSRIP